MNSEKFSINSSSAESQRGQLLMAYFLMLNYLILFIQACTTFPFVDHTSTVQNVIYVLIVTAPFYICTIAFIVLKRRDLSSMKK